MTSTDSLWFEGPHHSDIDATLRGAADLWDSLYHRAQTNGDVLRLCLGVISQLAEAARLAALQSRMTRPTDDHEP